MPPAFPPSAFARVCLALLLSLSAHGAVLINEFVAAGSDRIVHVGSSGLPQVGLGTPWQDPSFRDELWTEAPGPFGFGTFAGVTIATDTSLPMQGRTPSLYLRQGFTANATQAKSAESLRLVVRCNDGFVAYLNGVEVARRNLGPAGSFVFHDAGAFNPELTNGAVTIDLGAASTRLIEGRNVLCLQGHNAMGAAADAGNFLVSASLELSGATFAGAAGPWRYFIGVAEPSGGVLDHGLLRQQVQRATWASIEFNDFSWVPGMGPVGYETSSPADYKLGTDLRTLLYQKFTTVYTRTAFTASTAEASSTASLSLNIDYDDGIVVYLNGREVARRNLGAAGTLTPFSTPATEDHPANGDGGGSSTGKDETLNLGPASALLSEGNNMLAVQLANASAGSSDLVARVTLSLEGTPGRVLVSPSDALRYQIGDHAPAGEDSGANSFPDPIVDSAEDWIELRNTGNEAVDLSGWSLTDDVAKPRKWSFPKGSSLPPKGYLVILATELQAGPGTGASYPHAAFKLSSNGEYLGLVDAGGATIDALSPKYPSQTPRQSYGRDANGDFVYFDRATPGADNPATGTLGELSAPGFSAPGGFQLGPLSVSLSAANAEEHIRYTLDGSDPTPGTGTLYSAPIELKASATIRALSYRPGYAASPVVSQSYLLGQSAARRALPAICLSGDAGGVFYGPNAVGGPAKGCGILAIKGGRYVAAEYEDVWEANGDPTAYNIPMQRGQAFERRASLEFYPPSGTALRTDLGLRFAGSDWSRPRMRLTDPVTGSFGTWSGTQKPSLNLYFRSDFGSRPQVYPFIADNPVTSFEDLRLRAGKNDMVDPFITDELMRRIFLATGQQGSRGGFANVYINGVFKGYYNHCERLRDEFMRQHHGGKADWDVRQVGDIESGDAIEWNRLMAFLSSSDLSKPEAYSRAQELIDMDNVIDYLLVNCFAATWDWPLNNWVAARERSPQGRWRFYMWDAEGAFGIYGRRAPGTYDIFLGDVDGDGVADVSEKDYKLDLGADARAYQWKSIPAIYTFLRASPEFRLRWADRAQKHFFHNGALTRDIMEPLWISLRDSVKTLILEETGTTISERIRTDWIVSPLRKNTLFTQMLRQGLWVKTLAPEFSQHGGTLPAGASVSLGNPNSNGTVHYTTDGSDPRMPGGAASGLTYSKPVILLRSCTLKARVLSGTGEWSPLQEAAFTILDNSRLLISELMYNPTGGDAYEYIELKNVGSGIAYLEGASFTEGIAYSFEPGNTLAPGAFMVIPRTPASFITRYPSVPVPSVGYTGKLANEGERVTLKAADGRILASVSYGSVAPWPLEPAGAGRSLVPRNPDDNPSPDLASSWRASTALYGSPGADDLPAAAPVILSAPQDWSAGIGRSSTLGLRVSGNPAPTLRWQVSRDSGQSWTPLADGAVFTGTTTATLTLQAVDAALSGALFRCVIDNGVGAAVVSPAARLTALPASKLSNLSMRAQNSAGEGAVTAGLVVEGPSPTRFLIRAVGPRLKDFGVTAPLADPLLEVYRRVGTENQRIGLNDDWTTVDDPAELLAASARVGAFGIGDSDTKSSALVLELPAGAYTAVVNPPSIQTGTGIVLVEVYDLSDHGNALVNLSSRGFVGLEEKVMVPGFVIQGEAPQTFLVRAIGPGLAPFGLSGLLSDPRLRILRQDNVEIASNDDWSADPAAVSALKTGSEKVGAFPLTAGSKDAAMLVTLAPGSYTILVSGKDNQTGLALVELYAVP